MGRKKLRRIPAVNLAAVVRAKFARVETRNSRDAAFLRENAAPERVASRADAGDRTDPGDHRPSIADCGLRIAERTYSHACLLSFRFPQSGFRNFQVLLHAPQRLVRDVLDEK